VPHLSWQRGMVRSAARASDSYGLLLILLIIDYVLMALVDTGRWFGLVVAVPMSLTLVLAMHTSHARRLGMKLAWVAALIATVGGVASAISGTDVAAALLTLLISCLLAVTPFVVLRRILQHASVSVETLLGAISVYMVIGIFFGVLFYGIARSLPVFFGNPVPAAHQFLAQPGPHNPSDYLYLSFVTMTTVGFGDLTPLSQFARMVVVLEALIGQIFLVTLVARYGHPAPAHHGSSEPVVAAAVPVAGDPSTPGPEPAAQDG